MIDSLAQVTTDSTKPEVRVLQVFGTMGVGGAEMWLLSLLRYFKNSADELPFRVTTHICLTGGVPGELDAEAINLGARLHYIKYTRKDIPRFTRGFRRLLKMGRFHAVHDHQDYSAGIHLLLGIGVLPYVRLAHVHNPAFRLVEHRDIVSRFAGSLGKFVLSRVGARVLGTSEQLLQEYGFEVDAGDPVSPKAIYCGFDVGSYTGNQVECRKSVREEFGWLEGDLIALFVGRLGGDEIAVNARSHKNPMFALQVFERAIEIQPNLRMLFVGEKGPMHQFLMERVNERNLTQAVKFIGIRHDIARLMLGSDALLFPSSAEGLGMVAVEAQAAGLRVLASDTTPKECVAVPGLVTFLSLSAPPEVWAEHLTKLISISPPDLRSANAAVAASPFSIPTSARQLLEIYASGIKAGAADSQL